MSDQNKEEKKKDNFYGIPWSFLGGVAVGLAAGLYINSKAGRARRQQLDDKISSWESELEDKVKDSFEDIKQEVLNGKKKDKAADSDNKSSAQS